MTAPTREEFTRLARRVARLEARFPRARPARVPAAAVLHEHHLRIIDVEPPLSREEALERVREVRRRLRQVAS